MENNVTELVFILDKSGSMAGAESDVIGGFNGMIEKQKKIEGKAYVSTVLFSNFSTVFHDRVDLLSVKTLTTNDFQVGGCTALLDAIGGAIKHISNIHKYARPEDVPTNTMFIITTDGLENASVEFTIGEVRKLIEAKKENGWEFLFLADNIDAVETAENIGIKKERACNYSVKEDTSAMFDTVSDTVCFMRKHSKVEDDWAIDLKK